MMTLGKTLLRQGFLKWHEFLDWLREYQRLKMRFYWWIKLHVMFIFIFNFWVKLCRTLCPTTETFFTSNFLSKPTLRSTGHLYQYCSTPPKIVVQIKSDTLSHFSTILVYMYSLCFRKRALHFCLLMSCSTDADTSCSINHASVTGSTPTYFKVVVTSAVWSFTVP